MRKVYYTLDLSEAVLLKDRLTHEGVAAEVRNKGAVRIPYEGIASEVWIDGGDVEAVGDLIRAFVQERMDASRGAEPVWQCPHCEEKSPGEFEFCWNCSQARPAEGA